MPPVQGRAEIDAVIEFVDQLEPENIAARLRALGEKCDAVAVIAADHPLVSQAIQSLKAPGKPVVAYITDQSAPGRAGYVGTDNWKLGRTAAWFIAKTTRPGRVCVFIGNYRYQCQTSPTQASVRTCAKTRPSHRRGQPADPRGAQRRPIGLSRFAPRHGRSCRHLYRRWRDFGRPSGPLEVARRAARSVWCVGTSVLRREGVWLKDYHGCAVSPFGPDLLAARSDYDRYDRTNCRQS